MSPAFEWAPFLICAALTLACILPPSHHERLTMFTIDRLAKLDAIADAVFKALSSGLDWLGLKYEDFLIDATYRVVEAKARAVSKAEEKINALEDRRSAIVAEGVEAKERLLAQHRLALSALEDELYEREDALLADLAQAARSLVDAGKDYDATVDAALVKLDWEIAK